MSRKLCALTAALAVATASGVTAAAGAHDRDRTQDQAGTVASFTGGVLTITLGKGGTLAGTVSDKTKIDCHRARAKAANDGPRGHRRHRHRGPHGKDCGVEAFTTGAQVEEAELKAKNGEVVFERVELGA